MTGAPFYFEAVRCRASGRWDQLERDPELAGPWHQLFKQVQSPRHVVSELLQNADDAGATKASVSIEDGDFVFEHNGEDFTEEHFASLCRFGYSNKRALHTIGFRGVGFKSTFSIGDKVCLKTPSLSVCFHRERFTEPIWHKRNGIPETSTEIRVTIQDDHRLRELVKNLEDWTKSPASLLFFRSIRCLTVQGQEVRWQANSTGPVANSHWMALANDPQRQYLLIQSKSESFPDDALNEIRQERMVTIEEETSFPPCKIEIVLGFEGRLFVILPTGVKTDLPFACNAPFIQDPARVKIKDPETSPTNRWLLERVGQLSAEAMLEWLGQTDWDVKRRSEAYALLPDSDREDHSIEGSCGRIVEESFENALEEQTYLLTENGSLEREKGCVAVPDVLLDIWTSDQIQQLFVDDGLPILSRHINSKDRHKLANWNCFDEVGMASALDVIKSKHLPKPISWSQLLLLWAYVADDVVGYHYNRNHKEVRIIPVQGKDVLFSTSEVVRLGEKKLLHSEEDWQFLSSYLLVLNQNWPRYLASQRRRAEQEKLEALGKQVELAYKVLDELGLGQTSDTSMVIQQVAENFFNENSCDMEDCIRLAQLAATLGASVSENFQFVTQDGYRRQVSEHIVYDVNNDLDVFVPDQWYQSHVLHEDYSVLLSCTEEDWQQWIKSERSGLTSFVPLISIQKNIWERGKLEKLLQERDCKKEPYYRYVTNEFILYDWDFDATLWHHWKVIQDQDDEFWGRVFQRILAQHKDYWANAISANVSQVATTGRERSITHDSLLPSWIVKFRALPCLQDTRGHYRQPAELLCRTPETEALLDIEPFVRAELDTEANRQLLVMLGVRDTPTGPDRLLERLQALSTVENPPVYEVEKWCSRLDQILPRCSTDEYQCIKDAFTHQKLILSSESEWTCVTEVFLNADEEDAPGAAIVHPAIRSLSIWHKVGVAERPTAELSLNWLAGIESGKKLSKDELRRVRSLLPRYAERIWLECLHWLNLDGEWVPVKQLVYKLTMQTLIPWGNLFRPIKQKTADLQKLSSGVCGQCPFSELPSLASSIEDRFEKEIVGSKQIFSKSWITTLGNGLARIFLDDETEAGQIRKLGLRLANTRWCVVDTLRTTPYIGGTPSGSPRDVDTLWKDSILYVKSESVGKMAKAIAQELGRAFGRPDIADAIKLCFEREDTFIDDYLQENFKLLPIQEIEKEQGETDELSDETEDTSKSDDSEGNLETTLDSSTPETEDTESKDNDIEDNQEELQPDDGESPDDVNEPRKQPQKRTKPKLIERFAKVKGYVKDSGEGRFYHEDGSWIEHVSGNSFPWEQYSASGELMQCYWTKEHCIESEPLQLKADIWELCIKYPDKYTLILADSDGSPTEYSGKRICDLRDKGRLTLFSASYRIVYDQGTQSA